MTTSQIIAILFVIAFVIFTVVKPKKTDEKRPFLSLFGDTFKMPKCYESRKEIMESQADVESHGSFDGEVVGESNYQRSIWSMIPPEHTKAESFRLYFIATLKQEDDNEYDKNAVSVRIKNSTIGYLSKATAKKYRSWSRTQAISEAATCRCVIVKTSGKPYSVWLDLPFATT